MDAKIFFLSSPSLVTRGLLIPNATLAKNLGSSRTSVASSTFSAASKSNGFRAGAGSSTAFFVTQKVHPCH
ncbi:hypothetical protein BN1708_008814 [Verticillium longisporum]|uniref:Uncharacterized protein n=1 Tax=Verticillium longisporum TaxID=100787 RepID=A0A0G4N835_VERLO|nr:hypothetical protein BN1708_008814 [Verticillium longisporum]